MQQLLRGYTGEKKNNKALHNLDTSILLQKEDSCMHL